MLKPFEKNTGNMLAKPASNYSSLFVWASLILVPLFLIWNATSRYENFRSHQQQLMEHSVSAAADEVGLLVKELRRAVSLFAEENEKLLLGLVADPGNHDQYGRLEQKIARYFPEYLAFAIADQDGNPLLEALTGLVGGACRTDIRGFTASDGKYWSYIHKSPLENPYHFDVMSFTHTDPSQGYVFFVSFHTRALVRLLGNSQIYQHRLMLVKGDQPTLIEVTAQGDRKQLIRQPQLTSEEMARITFSVPVAGTLWRAIDLPAPDLFMGNQTTIWRQNLLILLAFVVVSLIMLWLISQERQRRAVAEQALLKSHDKLELRVQERTQELSKANANLQAEIVERERAEGALRESEEQYRDIFENTSDLIQSVAADGSIVYVNRAWRETLGYSEEEIRGLSLFDVVHPVSTAHCADAVQRIMAGERLDYVEFMCLTKDGRAISLEGSTSAVFNNGKPIGTRGIYRDVTERKRAEEEKRAHQAELAHVTRLNVMGEMTSGLAHEINQPLAAIINYMKGCIRRLRVGPVPSDELFAVMERTAAQAERAGIIIRRLRHFVRKGETRPVRLDVNEIVSEAAKLIEAEARQHEISIHLELNQDALPVLADMIQIEQVILNLVRNGIEAMNSEGIGKPELTIKTSIAERNTVEVDIIDTGPGVQSDSVHEVFNPFFTTKSKGLGIGLSISRSIIEAHNGQLWLARNGEDGATFRFRLPIRDEVHRDDG